MFRSLEAAAFKSHIEGNKKDFILFKTSILLKDAGNDPIKRAGIIREVVESIAKIPDGIKASVFVRECSSLLQIEERVLISELNKIRLGKIKKDTNFNTPQVHSLRMFRNQKCLSKPEFLIQMRHRKRRLFGYF
jgi:DNA primase